MEVLRLIGAGWLIYRPTIPRPTAKAFFKYEYTRKPAPQYWLGYHLRLSYPDVRATDYLRIGSWKGRSYDYSGRAVVLAHYRDSVDPVLSPPRSSSIVQTTSPVGPGLHHLAVDRYLRRAHLDVGFLEGRISRGTHETTLGWLGALSSSLLKIAHAQQDWRRSLSSLIHRAAHS